MNAIVLSIGDELVSGITVNTNSGWVARELAAIGIRTIAHVTVGDDVQAIASQIRKGCEELDLASSASAESPRRGGVLVITGGLGPTQDDLTRQGLADALNQELVEDPDAMVQIERFFRSINRVMSPSNRSQALRPHGATNLENTVGTAPGLRAKRGQTEIFVLPGVPREMREMFGRSVLPPLKQEMERLHGAPAVTVVSTINTFGAGESVVGERIRELMARTGPAGQGGAGTPVGSAAGEGGGQVSRIVGTTVHEGIVSVRIYVRGERTAAEEAAAELRERVRERLGALVFGEGDQTLEGVVGELLKAGKYTLATAESCTGGMVAGLLTNVPGSSAYFLRGWVTYANAAKHDELAIPEELILEHGAVSEAVARAMAEGARRFAGTEFALAITGIAGPEGGTPEKPVGTVWIALASGGIGGAGAGGTDVRGFVFPGNRAQVRQRAALMALAMLRWKLAGMAMPI